LESSQINEEICGYLLKWFCNYLLLARKVSTERFTSYWRYVLAERRPGSGYQQWI